MVAREKASDEGKTKQCAWEQAREASANARSLQRLQLTEHGRDQF
jgi:hypothetical protein